MRKIFNKGFFIIFVFLIIGLIPSKIATESSRIQGKDRYETSVQVSKKSFTSSQYAVIASGENFPDALSGGGLSVALNSPMLLVQKDILPRVVFNELKRLKTKKVYILGGKEVISEKVENTLKKFFQVERIYGEDRYQTSKEIALKILKLKKEKNKNMVIVNGENFADSLAAGGILNEHEGPLLLIPDTEDIKEETITFINRNAEKKYIIGGYEAISKETEAKIQNCKRFYGNNRFNTAISVAKSNFFLPENVVLVNGMNFPDALCATSFAIIKKAPILLMENNDMNPSVNEYLKGGNIKNVYIIGGENQRCYVKPPVIKKREEGFGDTLFHFSRTLNPISIYDDIKEGSRVLTSVPAETYLECYGEYKGYTKVKYGKFVGFVRNSEIRSLENTKLFKIEKGVILVNKVYTVPSDYNPGMNYYADTAFQKMKQDAAKENLIIKKGSSFRTYDYQKKLHQRYIRQHGEKDTVNSSAKEGHSEHQLGLAIDIINNNPATSINNRFKNTREYKWLIANAHKYGFILRYPEGKENITGYIYEPWHYRYVGEQTAKEIYEKNVTLEEYLKLK